jgi:hypothetical protein
MANLEVHHGEFRSHSGADSEENLITLCSPCHARVHRRKEPFTLAPHDSDPVVGRVFVVDRSAMTRARTTGDTILLGPGMNQ